MPKIGSARTSTVGGLALRRKRLESLLGLLVDLPSDFIVGEARASTEASKKNQLEVLSCDNYQELLEAWKTAMKWRPVMDEVLSTMLAVACSTMQIGDQLFLQVIGDAGGGKTRFCDALLVASKYCHALEHLTGFHSGYKSDDGKDYSLISRINGKTLITPEADVIVASPYFAEIMSQQRRIFDGTSGATYKNRDEDLKHTGLRTPWIMAGTPTLMDLDQSRLGDRFLKVFIESPGLSEKREILRKVGYTAIRSVMKSSNSEAKGQIDEAQAIAYAMTGGYVGYLRENVEELLSELEINEEKLVEDCALFAEFTADMRAKPDPNSNVKESTPTKEMPTRLTHQLVRLACCLAVVLNKRAIDADVMRRVRKVALDTSYGSTLNIVKALEAYEDAGADVKSVALRINKDDNRTRAFLRFLSQIDIVEHFIPEGTAKGKWRLTERFKTVYQGVMEYA